MFGLREKLSMSFAALLIVVLVLGAQTIRHLVVLESGVTNITQGSFEMALAAGDIQEGLARLDAGALNSMLGSAETGALLIGQGKLLVEAGLSGCDAHALRSDDRKRVKSIRDKYASYLAKLESILASGVPEASFKERYVAELKPLYTELFDRANGIEESSQNKVMALNLQTRQRVQDAKLQTLMVLGIAIFIAIAAIYATGRFILFPILKLTDSAEQIRKGNLDVTLPPVSNDELGRLTMAFNQMAASLKALRNTEKAQLLNLHRATEEIFGSLKDAIALVTPGGKVEVSTTVAAKTFQLVRGGKMENVAEPWLRELFERAVAVQETVHADAPQDVIQHFIGSDEHFFYPEGVPIFDIEGDLRAVMLMIHDVTQLMEQEDLKRDVVSTVSHQLKTPLTSIRMALHMLFDGKMGSLNEKQHDLVLMARDESDRLYRMLESLLDFNRMKSGRAQMECEALPVRVAVEMAVEHFRVQAADRNITLEAHVPDDLPDMWADASRLEHVFSNLISNALKYTEPGGRVTVSTGAEEKHVLIEVSDDGPGIPEQYVSKIFDQFFRVPDQDGVAGAGLGLAIVRQIVEAHRGTISMHSEVGQGATFIVRIPCAEFARELGLIIDT